MMGWAHTTVTSWWKSTIVSWNIDFLFQSSWALPNSFLYASIYDWSFTLLASFLQSLEYHHNILLTKLFLLNFPSSTFHGSFPTNQTIPAEFLCAVAHTVPSLLHLVFRRALYLNPYFPIFLLMIFPSSWSNCFFCFQHGDIIKSRFFRTQVVYRYGWFWAV